MRLSDVIRAMGPLLSPPAAGADPDIRSVHYRAQDVARSIGGLYAKLTSALSKHEVLIRSLSALPMGARGGIVKGGVYGGGN